MPDNETEWITIKQAADLLGLDRTTIWRWVNEKKVDAQQMGGWQWLVDKASLLAHDEQRKSKGE